jgi:hypothetical protein
VRQISGESATRQAGPMDWWWLSVVVWEGI